MDNPQHLILKPIEAKDALLISGLDSCDRFACIRVDGPDAETFLQGQLTQDMALVREGECLLAAHCTPKGRMTAIFKVMYWQEAFLLWGPKTMAESALSRLKKYVLRSKVNISLAPEMGLLRVWGSDASGFGHAKSRLSPELEFSEIGVVSRDTRLIEWVGPMAVLESFKVALKPLPALSSEEARLNEFLLSHVFVYPETLEAFIPQMLNLDETGGISFKKGCYTGQEIVARTHYLGRVKRRMGLFSAPGSSTLGPGQKVSDPTLGTFEVADTVTVDGVSYALAVGSESE